MTKLSGKTILVTGGASGIGRLMGDMCMQEGGKQLVIWDINKERLDETTRELRAFHFVVHPYVIDIANTPAVLELTEQVKSEVGDIDILINNAGIITGNKLFQDFTHEDIDLTMQVNSQAMMHVTLGFLPGMIRKGSGHIVNISSAAGMLSNPLMSVYCASKWAALGWSESLRIELERNKTGIRVLTVTPSYISTGMFHGVKVNRLMPVLRPEAIAAKIIRGLKNNRLFVRAPFLVLILNFARGILPVRLFDLIVGKWFGVYDSMSGFTARKSVN